MDDLEVDEAEHLEDEISRKRRLAALACIIYLDNTATERRGNMRRRREDVELQIQSLDDALFRRMYRLDRPRFRYILGLIREDIASDERGLKQAAKSSGCPVSPTIKLAVALRIAAGGSYLHAGPVELDVAEGDRVWQRGRMTHERIEEPDFVGLGLQVDNRRQGARSDLGSRKRKELTEYFRVWQIKRPKARPTSV